MFSSKETKIVEKLVQPDFTHIKINLDGKSLGYLISDKNVKIKKDFCSTYCEITLNEKDTQTRQLVDGIISVFGDINTNKYTDDKLKYIKREVEELEKIKNDYDRRLRALSISMQD